MVIFSFIKIIPVSMVQVCINLCGSFWSIGIFIFSHYFFHQNLLAESNFFTVRRNYHIINLTDCIKLRPGFSTVFGKENFIAFLSVNSVFIPLNKRFFTKV